MSVEQKVERFATLHAVGGSATERAINIARDALLARQDASGHWLFELEADCTIPAEFILMMHFLDEIDAALEPKLALFLRERQADHGGWPLYQRRQLRPELQRQGLLRAQAGGRRSAGGAHAVCAHCHPSVRRSGARQCVHSPGAGDVRPIALARRAIYPGRDHAAAEMVSISSRQGLVLVANCDGAAVRAVFAPGAREESPRGGYSRAVHDRAGTGAPLFSSRRPDQPGLPCCSTGSAA